MSPNKAMKQHLDAAYRIGLAEIERLARKILREHTNLDEFVMAMGGAFFVKKDGEHFHTWDCKYMGQLDRLITAWDDTLGLTGEPMRFTATGRKQTSWGAAL